MLSLLSPDFEQTQAPQKAITALTPSKSDTFFAGAADGRILSYSLAASECATLSGESHTNFVVGLATAPAGSQVYSAGFDDRVREIDSDLKGFTSVSSLGLSFYHSN